MAKKSPTTQAVRVLRDAGVDYTEHLFDHKRYPGAEMAAEALGADPHETAKTIVFTTDEGDGAVVVMHGDTEVSAKKLARLLDVKTVRPATQREARRVTGYQFGGTSPLGMRTDPPVFVHETLAGMDRIYVNGGSTGFLVEIEPGTLIEICGARVEDVAAD